MSNYCDSKIVTIAQHYYSDEFILDVNKFSGYGIAYTGYGHVGFYNLSIQFDQPMKFTT